MNFVDDNSYYPQGYVIHANCWTLIEKIIGPKAEERLDLFLQVLKDRWAEDPFELVEHADSRIKWYLSHRAYLVYWDMSHYLRLEAMSISLEEGSDDDIHRIENASTQTISCFRDPLMIPEAYKLIKKAISTRRGEEMVRKTRRWSLSGAPKEHLTPALPLEVKLHILDKVDGKDIKNVLRAFSWRVPDAFWKARFPRKVFFEIENVLEEGVDVDWMTLYLGACELLGNLPEFRNRQRIIRILEGTRDLFLARGGWKIEDCRQSD